VAFASVTTKPLTTKNMATATAPNPARLNTALCPGASKCWKCCITTMIASANRNPPSGR